MKFRTVIPAVVALVLIGCATPTQLILDAEVDRLCAVDGGMKIYEQVALSPHKFNQWGQVNFYRPTQGENALGEEFLFMEKKNWIKPGNPATSEGSIVRLHYSVYRRSDSKLLGELVSYGRGGGNLPGPWHPSTYRCPIKLNDITLLTKIFVIGEK